MDMMLALREVTRRKRRSAVALVAVAFGVISLLLASGFIEWVLWAMREGTIQGGLGHVQITRPGYLESGLSDPLSYLLSDRSPERSFVEEMKDSETVAPRITFYGLISLGDATLSFQGDGIRPDREAPLSIGVQYASGNGLSEDPTAEEVLLGRGLAENLGAQVGDRVVLLANTSHGGINAVEATVKGVFTTVTKAYDDIALRLPLRLAQRLLRVEGSTKWIVLLRDTDDTERAISILNQRLSAKNFSLSSWKEIADFYNKTVALFSKQVAVLNLIIALVVVLAISNSMTIAVVERTGEIGTAMALGVTRTTVLRRFLVEGLTLGLLGAAIGLIVGVAAAHLISAVGIPMPPPPGMARGYVGQILVTPGLVLQGALVVVVSSVAAAILPAFRASRMIIVDAIRRGA